MKCFDELINGNNTPRLIPSFKKTERRLLSVFLALLDISPNIRGEFFRKCGCGFAASGSYRSVMEPSYSSSKYSEARPDGLVSVQRGATTWGAFVEAKTEGSGIRPEQILDYVKLADLLGVETVISISNEFARTPEELPYYIQSNKRKSKSIFHFAWADIRTFLELARTEPELSDVEIKLLQQCLEYFWDEQSGIRTFDSMPENWPAFVEASSTTLGFNSKVKGFMEIIYGWQQERRDLCSKLTHRLGRQVQLRHEAGVRSTEEDRLATDRALLAENYCLAAKFLFGNTKTELNILSDLRACRTTAILEIPVPAEKGPKAITTILTKTLQGIDHTGLKITFDFPGRNNDISISADVLERDAHLVHEGRKQPPKSVLATLDMHGVRRFKSRKKFVEDVEALVDRIVAMGEAASWIKAG